MRITRRTRFALPLVLVVGCGSSPNKATTAPPNTEITPSKSEETPPTTESESQLDPPGSGKVTKSTTPEGVTVLTYESGDRIYVHKDGRCIAEYSSNCGQSGGPEEPRTCNPPPPQEVKCPADAK